MKIYEKAKEKKELIELVRHYCNINNAGFSENLSYVVRFLHEDFNLFSEMMEHARSLRKSSGQSRKRDINYLVAQLKDSEVGLVTDYLKAIFEYVRGSSFDKVYDSATNLLRSLKLAEGWRTGEYSEEEVLAYKSV